MHGKIIAMVAALSLGGSGAFAQTNAPTLNAAPTSTTTPSGPGAPTVPSSSPHAQNPLVNPDAAGAQRGWRGYGGSSVTPAERRDQPEYGGSKPPNANTHPLKALRTGKQRNPQQRPVQTGSSSQR